MSMEANPTRERKRRLPPEGSDLRYGFYTLLQCPNPDCQQWREGFTFDHKELRDDGIDKHATCKRCKHRFIAVGNLSEE